MRDVLIARWMECEMKAVFGWWNKGWSELEVGRSGLEGL